MRWPSSTIYLLGANLSQARGAEQAVLVCVLLDAIAVAPVVQEAALVAPAAETVVAAVVAAPVAAGTFSE